MTTILFNLVLFALALDLIIWGIDQGWSLVNRYKTQWDLRPDKLSQKYTEMLELQVAMDAQRREAQRKAEQKPRSKVVPLWQHNHGGDDGHGHA